MFPPIVLVSHEMHPPLISWDGPPSPETTSKMMVYNTVREIASSLPDVDLVDDSASELFTAASSRSGSSSTSSSLKSNASSFPTMASDDHVAARAKKISNSLSCHVNALDLISRPGNPTLTRSDAELHPDLNTYYQPEATPSQAPPLGELRSFSRTIIFNLKFPADLNIIKLESTTVMMDVKLHFQVLIGNLAELLSISPELVDLAIQRDDRVIRLSPIASPHELGFSNELTILVRLRKVAMESHPNLPDSLEQPRRIPGTKWIHSFPSTKYKFGLPSSPACSSHPV